MMIIGKTASVAAAIIVGYSLPYWPCIFARPAESVVVEELVQTIIGHIRSLKAKTAVKIPSEIMELRVSGIMMCRNLWPTLQPYMMAASSRSLGRRS